MLPIAAMMSFGASMAGLAGKRWENLETLRRTELQMGQIEGQTKANQAASGIETIGGASPGAQIFQETQHREFRNQLAEMKRGMQMAEIGGLIGAAGGLGGSAASSAFQMADLNRTGATFTPSLTMPSSGLQLPQSDFVKGALQTGPTWRP